MNSTLQEWVHYLSLMQQAVLLSAIRGPDGVRKKHPCKDVIRWYRRSILVSAFDREALLDPSLPGGGSFTGPSCDPGSEPWETRMSNCLDEFIVSRDELPYHYTTHFMHAAQILGYKHPDSRVRDWWNTVYVRMVHANHVYPESEKDMDLRLGDKESDWLERSDEAGSCSV